MAVYLILSAISVIIRPTGAVLFGPLFVYHFLVSNKRFRLVSVALLIGYIQVAVFQKVIHFTLL